MNCLWKARIRLYNGAVLVEMFLLIEFRARGTLRNQGVQELRMIFLYRLSARRASQAVHKFGHKRMTGRVHAARIGDYDRPAAGE